MHTTIGQKLNSIPGKSVSTIIAAFILLTDFTLVWRANYSEIIQGRAFLTVLALASYLWLVQGDFASLGLRFTPKGGWRQWTWFSLRIGFAVVLCIMIGVGGWYLLGGSLPVITANPKYLASHFLRMCLFAPMFEEMIYRFVLCGPLAALLGPWRAIILSGLAFGGLHILYGNPSPENLVGGIFLAWAYLKSESIVIPLLLHSLGNLCVLFCQVGAWYWLGGTS